MTQQRLAIVTGTSSGIGHEVAQQLLASGWQLRLAGMVLASELDFRDAAGTSRDATIWSYEPELVATPMQETVRTSSAETIPIVHLFQQFAAEGRVLQHPFRQRKSLPTSRPMGTRASASSASCCPDL